MIELSTILKSFDPISLKEMDAVKLMDRTDTKFVLTYEQLLKILPEVKEEYKVLEIGEARTCKYETLYYDTDDFSLYHKHQNRKMNRYKIRARNYTDSHLSFFEVKFKNNKGRTIKERIKIPEIGTELNDKEKAFLTAHTNIGELSLKPQIWVDYYRTTLVSRNNCERVTIDTGLCFRKNNETKNYNQLAIIEIKQEKSKTSRMSSVLKSHSVREGSLSKYCLGILSTNPEIKQNNFKQNIRSINKLLHA